MQPYKNVQTTDKMGPYDILIHAIIRPPKATYNLERLGPSLFTNKVGTLIRRVDQEIFHGDELLKVSLFLPTYESNPSYLPPNLILYCHCNSSNRLECKSYVNYLPYNYGICGFDFLGCGNSPNMYISLGIREKEQVRTLINVMRTRFQRVIPWGRSMGAVSVLLYGEAPIMVVDSPFVSIRKIGQDQLDKNKCAKCCLGCLFPCAWCCVKQSIQKRAQYNANDVNTLRAVKSMSPHQAIIFIAAKNDSLVKPTHSKKLYDRFPGRKAFLLVDGTHNTPRKKETFDEALSILDRFIGENNMFQQLLQMQPTYPMLMPAEVYPVTTTTLVLR